LRLVIAAGAADYRRQQQRSCHDPDCSAVRTEATHVDAFATLSVTIAD
jgi:hypothetical protein